jgi:hypothetical protein
MTPVLLAYCEFSNDGYAYEIKLYKHPLTDQYLVTRRWGKSTLIKSLVWETTDWGDDSLQKLYDGKIQQKQKYGMKILSQADTRKKDK